MWRGIMRILLPASIFAKITRTYAPHEHWRKKCKKEFYGEDAELRVIVVSRSHGIIKSTRAPRKNNTIVESSSKRVRHSVHVSEITRLYRNYNGMQIRAAAVQLRLAIIRPRNLETGICIFVGHANVWNDNDGYIHETLIRIILFSMADYFLRQTILIYHFLCMYNTIVYYDD